MNLLRKKLFVLLLVVIFVLAGCTKVNDNNQVEPKPSDDPGKVSPSDDEKEPGQDPSEPPENEAGGNDEPGAGTDNGEDETIFEVKDSEQIGGWKQLTLKDYAYTTEDWFSYSYQDGSPLIAYVLNFPSGWDVEYSVFTNENGEKVAELFPPIMMTEGQSLLDNWQVSSECELISKEDIKVGDLTGARTVLKAYPHGGDIDEWYPYTYYLTDGKRVFAMSFYALEVSAEKQKQFDGIIDSFNFLD